jgi:hypothetical protein
MNLVHIEALGAFIRGLRSDTYWPSTSCMHASQLCTDPSARGYPGKYVRGVWCMCILLIVVEHGACFAEQARKTSTNSKL